MQHQEHPDGGRQGRTAMMERDMAGSMSLGMTTALTTARAMVGARDAATSTVTEKRRVSGRCYAWHVAGGGMQPDSLGDALGSRGMKASYREERALHRATLMNTCWLVRRHTGRGLFQST